MESRYTDITTSPQYHPFSIDALTSSLDEKDYSANQNTMLQMVNNSSLCEGHDYREGFASSRSGSESSSPVTSPLGNLQASPPTFPKSSCKIDIAQTLLELEERASGTMISSGDKSKPTHSYIALISQAILSSPDRKMLLGDIYQFISEHYPYYKLEQKAWRNSIRHNLSINECFIKDGKLQNKGNYWAIHPACVADFAKGDYRRRQARRRARRCDDLLQNSAPFPVSYGCHTGYVQMTTAPGYNYHPYQQVTVSSPAAVPSHQRMHTYQQGTYQPATYQQGTYTTAPYGHSMNRSRMSSNGDSTHHYSGYNQHCSYTSLGQTHYAYAS